MNKKYDVLNGAAIIAKEMDLDVALALIRGYIENNPNGHFTMTLQEAAMAFCSVSDNEQSNL